MQTFRPWSADPLAELTDEDILELQKLEVQPPTEEPAPWWEKFQYDLYDWNDPEFKEKNVGPFAYLPIRLTQGYFMMVSPDRYEEMTRFRDGVPMVWNVDIRTKDDQITGVYAKRTGRVRFESVTKVLAHRYLLDIVDDPPSIVGDHINGYGLDNRCRKGKAAPVNLISVGRHENMHNTIRFNRQGLPPGVERTGTGDACRYNGKVCVRRSKTKVVTIRSKMKWKTPEPAAVWYQNHLKRKCKRTMWAHRPETVNFPIFPPLKPEYRKVEVHVQTFELEETF